MCTAITLLDVSLQLNTDIECLSQWGCNSYTWTWVKCFKTSSSTSSVQHKRKSFLIASCTRHNTETHLYKCTELIRFSMRWLECLSRKGFNTSWIWDYSVNSDPAVSFASLSIFHSALFAKRRACHLIYLVYFTVLAVGSCINVRSMCKSLSKVQ